MRKTFPLFLSAPPLYRKSVHTMKRLLAFVLAISLLSLSACKPPDNPPKKTERTSPPFGDYFANLEGFSTFSKTNFDNIPVISQDDMFFYLRETANFTELYPGVSVQTGTIAAKNNAGDLVNISIIADDGLCYTSWEHIDKQERRRAEIGTYDLHTGKYTMLIEQPTGSGGVPRAVGEHHLAWADCPSAYGYETSYLHLYDLRSNTDELIYTFENYEGRAGIWGKATFFKNALYFDDAFENDGAPYISVFRYDLGTKSISEVQRNAMNPFRTGDELFWTARGISDDKLKLVSYDGNTQKTVFECNEEETKSVFQLSSASGVSVYSSSFYLEPEEALTPNGNLKLSVFPQNEETTNSNGIQVHSGGKTIPIIAGQPMKYILSQNTNGKFVSFGYSNDPSKPVFYDMKHDRLVTLDMAKEGYRYVLVCSDRYLLYTRLTEPELEEISTLTYYLVDMDALP